MNIARLFKIKIVISLPSHPNVVHLFAINHARPALIFCDSKYSHNKLSQISHDILVIGLIPIMKIWNDASSVVKFYLEWRVVRYITSMFYLLI